MLGPVVDPIQWEIYEINSGGERRWREVERKRSRNLMVKVLSCENSRWRICWWIKISGSW